MKLLPLLLLISLPAYAVDWEQHPYDKVSHVVGGAAISCGVTWATKKPLLGAFAGLLAGAIKEKHDDRFDRADLASWGVGGLVGTLCIKF
jgi:hypothetical protein